MSRPVVLLMVALSLVCGCAQREAKEATPRESTAAEFRIALREAPYMAGEAIASGDFTQLNYHSFPVTIGEGATLVSVSDGVTLEARWDDAEIADSGNPSRRCLFLRGFSWRLPNRLVSARGDSWAHTSWTDEGDLALATYWDHCVTPVPVQEADGSERALCLQWRWPEGKRLKYGDFPLSKETEAAP